MSRRRTSIYRLIVAVPGLDFQAREGALDRLISQLPEDLGVTESYHQAADYAESSPFQCEFVSVSYRAKGDIPALMIANDALEDYFAENDAKLMTGFGPLHTRLVAEQHADRPGGAQ